MTSQQNTPTPGFLERALDFKVQWKLFWMLHKDPEVSPLLKFIYWVCVFVFVPAYICAPDLVPGPLDDLLVSWWLIPLVLSHVFVWLSPDWLVKYYRQEITDEENEKIQSMKFSKAKSGNNPSSPEDKDFVDADWKEL